MVCSTDDHDRSAILSTASLMIVVAYLGTPEEISILLAGDPLGTMLLTNRYGAKALELVELLSRLLENNNEDL